MAFFCDVRLVLKKLQILEHFRFQIFELSIPDLYFIVSVSQTFRND